MKKMWFSFVWTGKVARQECHMISHIESHAHALHNFYVKIFNFIYIYINQSFVKKKQKWKKKKKRKAHV